MIGPGSDKNVKNRSIFYKKNSRIFAIMLSWMGPKEVFYSKLVAEMSWTSIESLYVAHFGLLFRAFFGGKNCNIIFPKWGGGWGSEVFLTIWDPFGPIWTHQDHFKQELIFCSEAPFQNPTLSIWGKKIIFAWNGRKGSRWAQKGSKWSKTLS